MSKLKGPGLRYDIMFLIRSMDRGGAERQLSLLARALHGSGVRVCVAVFYAGGSLEQELHDAGIPVLDLRKSGRWSNFGMVRRLVHFIRRYRPRVLHPYLSTQNVQALLLRPLLRRMDCAVACGIRTSLKNAWHVDKATGIVDLAQALLLPTADCVISNSYEAHRQWEKHCRTGRGHCIPNGIEFSKFEFSAEKRRAQRLSWGVKDDEVLIGTAGRIDSNKNQALLIRAAPYFKSPQTRPVKLVFVGGGAPGHQSLLEAEIDKAGLGSDVIVAGQVTDMSAAYAAMDVFCLCSTVEGFPNVLAEAMCAGLPCVSTNAGDARLVIGEFGWVAGGNDPASFGASIASAISALPCWDRDEPRRHIIENFSVDTLAEKTLVALAPLLAGNAHGDRSVTSTGWR